MVIVSLPGTQPWPAFLAAPLLVLRVVQLAVLRAVAPVQIPALAHPAPLEVVQEALPAALQAVSPDPRHGLTGKKTASGWCFAKTPSASFSVGGF